MRGEGRYTDDISLPGQTYAVIVRSRYAHGIIRKIDTDAARKMKGVLGVYTGADLAAAGYGTLKCIVPFKNRDGSEMKKPPRHALATDRVRFVGDPIAFVVAETLNRAKDAAEAIAIDIEPLPAVTDPEAGRADADAPQLYDDVPGNLSLDYHFGDADKVAAAFAKAAHVTRLKIVNNRVVVNAMEPRAAVGAYENGRFTLHTCSQGVVGMKGNIAALLDVEPEQVRVVSGNVGGSFGMKAAPYPEYVCVLHAARALGRPVKWTDERSGSFVSDSHGRDHRVNAELALDAEGHFLAVRLTIVGNMGGFLANVGPMLSTQNAVKNVQSVYRTPLIEVSTKCVFTNSTHVSAYRGAGRPEGNYYMERLIDTAAAEMGIDRLELRRRNHIRPRELPFKAPLGGIYDSGEFPGDHEGGDRGRRRQGLPPAQARKPQARQAARARHRQLSRGDGAVVKGARRRRVRGRRNVTILTGTLDFGMGHATPFAQVLHQTLGIPFEKIRLMQTDSDRLAAGGGSGGSKSLMHTGTALVEASAKVIDQGKVIASHVLEASAGDIEFENGRFVIAGTDRAIGIMELAAKLRAGINLPDGVPTSLDINHVTDGPSASAYPNGCHVCEVEIDPDTGVVEVVKYSAVNDFGTVVNPLIVEGQLHGGVVQGIGQALMERTVYDDDGQLLTGSFMDYALPRADDAPMFDVANHPVPAKTNPLGAKGCGEAGCAGSLTSIMNAVADALSEYGIRHIDMPATPYRVWQAIQAAGAARPS